VIVKKDISSVFLNVSLACASDISLFDSRSSVLPSRNATAIKRADCQIFVLAAPHDNCRQLKFIKNISFVFNKSNLLHA
jgi:hypothetical protein